MTGLSDSRIATLARARPELRRGPRHWLSGYVSMLRFDVASQRTWLPMFLLTQVLFGAGMAIIYGFYLGHASRSAIAYIVTGAPALAVITAALIGVSTIVTERQIAGTWDFIWSLPAPRSAAVASTFTVYTAMTIPGIVVALVLASWRYGIHLVLPPAMVPAFILASLMATSIGFAMAVAIPNPARHQRHRQRPDLRRPAVLTGRLPHFPAAVLAGRCAARPALLSPGSGHAGRPDRRRGPRAGRVLRRSGCLDGRFLGAGRLGHRTAQVGPEARDIRP